MTSRLRAGHERYQGDEYTLGRRVGEEFAVAVSSRPAPKLDPAHYGVGSRRALLMDP